MKNLSLFIFVLYVSLNGIAQVKDYAEIHIIGFGEKKKLYFNDQLITSFGNNEIIRYKIYSKGRINISVYMSSQGYVTTKLGGITISENKTYYYSAGNREVVRYALYENEVYSIADADTMTNKKGKKIKYVILKDPRDNVEVSRDEFEWIKANYETKKAIQYKFVDLEENKNAPFGNINTIYKNEPKQGTCFLIDKRGYILTNYHVIENSKKISVKGVGGDFSTLFAADVIAIDADLDLALLKLKSSLISFPDVPFSFSMKIIQQGTRSFILGYPLTAAMGQEIKATEGIISAKSGFKGSISQYQFSASVQPGNSGSPLFDENGQIIGIVNAKLSGAESAGYAIKFQYIMTFLNLIEDFEMEYKDISLSDKSLIEKIKILKGNVFIIRAE